VRVRAHQGSIVLRRKERRDKGAEFTNADFAEALNGESKNNRSDGRKSLRKTQQFCRQVQRALNLALSDSTATDSGCDLFVDEVSPGPDCGHLLVHVVVQDGYSIAEALSALRCDASRLRSEVAMAIARKRAPELTFVPVSPRGGGDV
jgi:ribosome-binding factor A